MQAGALGRSIEDPFNLFFFNQQSGVKNDISNIKYWKNSMNNVKFGNIDTNNGNISAIHSEFIGKKAAVVKYVQKQPAKTANLINNSKIER